MGNTWLTRSIYSVYIKENLSLERPRVHASSVYSCNVFVQTSCQRQPKVPSSGSLTNLTPVLCPDPSFPSPCLRPLSRSVFSRLHPLRFPPFQFANSVRFIFKIKVRLGREQSSLEIVMRSRFISIIVCWFCRNFWQKKFSVKKQKPNFKKRPTLFQRFLRGITTIRPLSFRTTGTLYQISHYHQTKRKNFVGYSRLTVFKR